jgi:uncharacterized NAD(P)/FAD-binding protein YdhS
MTEAYDIAIVGGGFAGSLVAIQLARRAQAPLRIVLFDRADAFGRGAAYSPTSDACLLNVRAKAMGAFPEAERDFLRWLRAAGYGADDVDLGERFMPRRLYGRYLCELLDRSAARGTIIERRPAEVVGLEPEAQGALLQTADGARTFARGVVLAIGNLPPGGFGDSALDAAMARHARNPWQLLAGGAPVEPDADVFVVGTSLTALDVVLHLAASGHRGRIAMLSRRGRFPLAHPAQSDPCVVLPAVSGSPATVVRAVRVLVAEGERVGRPWQDTIDALRPQLNRIWQSWPVDEQRRFARHVAPVWEIHRHRVPQSTLDVRDALAAAGRLRVFRGRLVGLTIDGSGLRAAFTERAAAAPRVERADVIVDCTGPRRNITASGDPFVKSLLDRELVQPSPLALGFAAHSDGSLAREASGLPLFALGTPLRGLLAETSAVREIRCQAETVAVALLSALTTVEAPRAAAGA